MKRIIYNSRRLLSLLICSCILSSNMPSMVFASSNHQKEESVISIGEIGGYLRGSIKTASKLYEERLFSLRTGHGFSAERGNNLVDRIHGVKGYIVGDDNAKNGPDRKIVNRSGEVTLIQDKYYSSGAKSVETAFDINTGEYRYVYEDNSPMILEVPKDQYADAVVAMEDKIKSGKVKTVTDPSEAKNIVKAGNLTYKQAVNLTKAGNIDSLKYDATNGIITATGAFGISFTLDYVLSVMNGTSQKEALKNASMNGLRTGGIVFATYVISNQLAKTGIVHAMAPTADAIAKTLGDDVCKAILDTAGVSIVGSTSKLIQNAAARVIERQILAQGVLVIVMTVPDAVDLFRGRISKEQLAKNLCVAIVSIGAGAVGATGGAALGTFILPGIGTTVGEILGGVTVGGIAAVASELFLRNIYAGDAELMYQVIAEEFQIMSEEYLIDEDEGNLLVDKLNESLKEKILKDMFESEDRQLFARNLMGPLFDEVVSARDNIDQPNEMMVRIEMMKSMQRIIIRY